MKEVKRDIHTLNTRTEKLKLKIEVKQLKSELYELETTTNTRTFLKNIHSNQFRKREKGRMTKR